MIRVIISTKIIDQGPLYRAMIPLIMSGLSLHLSFSPPLIAHWKILQ